MYFFMPNFVLHFLLFNKTLFITRTSFQYYIHLQISLIILVPNLVLVKDL